MLILILVRFGQYLVLQFFNFFLLFIYLFIYLFFWEWGWGRVTCTRYYTLLQAVIVSKLKKNLRTKLEKMSKKPSFRSHFELFGLNLCPQRFFWQILLLIDVRHCCMLSLYPILWKTNEPHLRKRQKT